LSNLTKILIVLLTISSIFLCGIVVTYVASADNYREKYKDIESKRDALEENVESLNKQLNEKVQQKDELEKTLKSQLAAAKTSADELQAKLSNVEREKAELLERVNSWASITKDFQQTTEKHTQTLNAALEEVKQLKAEQIKLSKELEQTSTTLVEKMAMMESLEAEKRRRTEEKAELESRLDKLLQAGGKEAVVSPSVTPERGVALPVRPDTEPIDLKGRVTEVDLKSSLATISLGSADGVREGMKFHVTRGDAFICDVLIVDVDVEKSVGVLELVQQPPKVGDNASTNL
jgi:DNA polymerase III alpha subunit (gram-positive type)